MKLELHNEYQVIEQPSSRRKIVSLYDFHFSSTRDFTQGQIIKQRIVRIS